MKITLEEESKLTAIAKLPEKWRAYPAGRRFNSVFQACAEELEAALAADKCSCTNTVTPAPAGKLTDEQLGEIGAKAIKGCVHWSDINATFARAVREAVENQQAEEIARLSAELDELKAKYSDMCTRLQECVQTHKLGLGGENIDKLVVEAVANLTAKLENQASTIIKAGAEKHKLLAIIEQAIEMVNTPGTTQDNLPKAINAKIIQRDEFHDATLKKLDAAKDEIKRLLQLDATNRENFDRTRKALVESQLLQLATQKALAKANAELVRLRWRPVRVKPTEADADSAGRITTTSKRGEAWQVPWHTNLEGTLATHWRPFCPPPIPTAEEKERAEFEKACVQFDVSFTRDIGGNYRDSRTLVLFEVWMLSRASAESKTLTQQEERK